MVGIHNDKLYRLHHSGYYNRIGVSTSYNEVRSARNLLAGYYAVQSSDRNDILMPGHFTRCDFTTGAFDNADYSDKSSLSGMHSLHYTASVVFQDAVNKPHSKPPVPFTGLRRSDRHLQQKLPCQIVPPHQKPVIRPILPPDIMLVKETCDITLLQTNRARELASRV